MFSKIKTNLQNNLIFYYLLFSGLLIRLIFATFPSFHVDADTNFAWSMRVVEVGLEQFYSKDIWTNYTPGMIYVFYFLGFLKNTLSLSSEIFYFVLKIPSVLSDLVLSYFVYRELLKNGKKIAFYGLSFCLFNPIFIFNSSIWGAFDSIMTLFLFLAIYYLNQKKIITSSIFYGISILIKPQSVAILPVYGFFLLKNFSIKNVFKIFFPTLAIIILLSIPFFPSDPLFGFFKLFIQMTQDYKGSSLFAYNLWGIFGFWIDDGTTLGFLPYQIWGIILLSIFWIYFYLLFFKRKFDAFTLSTLAFLVFFFLPTRVHERYLFSAFPFLILILLKFRSKILLLSTIALSVFHFFNLYFVYVYYNEFYLKLPKVLYIPKFYELLESQSKSLSIISTLLFIIITINISWIILSNEKPPRLNRGG